MFNPYIPLKTNTRYLLGGLGILTVLVLWTAVSVSGLVSQNKLPSPLAVLNALSYLSYYEGQSQLLSATIASGTRVLMATLLVMLIGIPAGIIMGSSPKLNAFFSPLIDPFRSAPIVAILPILVMWLGIGEEMKIVFLFLGAVVYMIPMVRDAIVAVPYSYYESTRDLGATTFECITRAVIPMAAPRIADAIIVSVSIMWTYINVAEYVNAGTGLGSLIQNARRFSAMDQVFAAIFVIIFLALVTYQLMTLLKKKVFHWEGKQ